MKLYTILALVLFPVLCHATDWKCMPFDSNARSRDVFTFPQSLPSLLATLNVAGGGVTWFCDQKYYYHRHFFVGSLGTANLDELRSFSAKTSTDQRASLDANTKVWDVKNDDPVYGILAMIANEQLNRTTPPAIIWKVAKNGTSTTRPVFPVTSGKRSTTASSERVAIAAQCKPTSLVLEEPIVNSVVMNVYASVEGLPNANGGTIQANRVALCERQ